MNAVSIALTRGDPGKVGVPNMVIYLFKFDASLCAFIVDEAKFDFLRDS